MLLLDGFDHEFPVELQKNSFIFRVLNRRLLPNCGLIVSSCSHAIVDLREWATVRVDILGFTEKEQNQFIQGALKSDHKVLQSLPKILISTFLCAACV